VRRATHNRLVDDIRRAHAREREQWLREREALLDRLMYLAGRPWNGPPIEEHSGPAPEVNWDGIVMPEEITPEELGDLADKQDDLSRSK
jgi:hypothetical protein